MSKVCLSLVCLEPLRERLVEVLLHVPELELFVSTSAFAHGLSHSLLNAKEEVLGMASMTYVQALMAESDHAKVLNQLGGKLASTGVRYWITPVLEQGEFS